MKNKKKTAPVVASNSWWCHPCKTEEMTHPEMMEHLKTAHGLNPKGLKCSKKMTMHIDCSNSFTSSYDVTIQTDKGELQLTQTTTNPRQKGDLMAFLP